MRNIVLAFFLCLVTCFAHGQRLSVSSEEYPSLNLPADDQQKGKSLKTIAKVMRWTGGSLAVLGLVALSGDSQDGQSANGVTYISIGTALWIGSIPIMRKGKNLASKPVSY